MLEEPFSHEGIPVCAWSECMPLYAKWLTQPLFSQHVPAMITEEAKEVRPAR